MAKTTELKVINIEKRIKKILRRIMLDFDFPRINDALDFCLNESKTFKEVEKSIYSIPCSIPQSNGVSLKIEDLDELKKLQKRLNKDDKKWEELGKETLEIEELNKGGEDENKEPL